MRLRLREWYLIYMFNSIYLIRSMASQPAKPSNFNPEIYHNITLNSDGSLTRPTIPSSPPTPKLTTDSQLTLSKDIPLDPTNATFVRIYRPVTSSPNPKLPIIVYFHGGGFVFCNASDASTNLSCSKMSAHCSALVISVEYRLAPEHRLPAAYDDGLEAIMWVRDQALKSKVDNGSCDEWLDEFGDFSKVYLMGTSAGGNLAYFAGLRSLERDLNPITIVGLILDQPYFGKVERTKSELRLVDDHVLPLAFTDSMWSLTLPLGSNKDHEYCNPLGDQHRSSFCELIKRLPKCLIRTHEGDPLVDIQKEFANMLEALGVHITRKFYEEGSHVVEVSDPKKLQIMFDDVKIFT